MTDTASPRGAEAPPTVFDFLRHWPGGVSGETMERVMDAWAALKPVDQSDAVACIDRFLAWSRDNPYADVYLSERLWRDLSAPPVPDPAGAALTLGDFKRSWPTGHLDDAFRMRDAWDGLPVAERQAIRPYPEFRKSAGRRTIPAGYTYLRDRPWRDGLPSGAAVTRGDIGDESLAAPKVSAAASDGQTVPLRLKLEVEICVRLRVERDEVGA